MEYCLEIRGAKKRYHGGRDAVRGVDLAVRCGDVVAILGPNGSGKSTLLAMAAGSLRPSAGRFLVGGIDVWGPEGLKARRLVGYLPQVEPLHPLLTGWENLRLHASMRGVRVDKEFILELADMLGLQRDALGRRVGGYSGGMRRKLSIIAALLHKPKVVLLDEPDSGLDPASRRGLVRALLGYASRFKAAVVFSTHIGETAAHASRVALMHEGRVVAEGEPGLLVKKYTPGHRVEVEVRSVESFLRDVRSVEGVEVIGSKDSSVTLLVRGGPELVAEIAKLAARHGLRSMSAREPSLEDVFLAVTGVKLEG